MTRTAYLYERLDGLCATLEKAELERTNLLATIDDLQADLDDVTDEISSIKLSIYEVQEGLRDLANE